MVDGGGYSRYLYRSGRVPKMSQPFRFLGAAALSIAPFGGRDRPATRGSRAAGANHQSARQPGAPRLQVEIDRPRRPGRSRRRLRRRREEPVHVLRRLRRRRRREDGQQRHDVRAGVRYVRRGIDRRPRAGAVRSEHPLRRHRRSEQPPDDVVRRRPVQEHRRRKDVHQHRLQDGADARARHRASARSEHRLDRGRRPSLRLRTPSAASS